MNRPVLQIRAVLHTAALLCLAGAHFDDSRGVHEEEEFVSSTLRRVEHFALQSADGQAVGLVEWRERVVEGGLVLERDIQFASEPLTIRHVERLTEDTNRLVWREVAPGVGRSQIVEPLEDGLVIIDWLRSGVERTSVAAASSARFPLALLEQLRDGIRMPNAVYRYWPLTRSVEQLQVVTNVLDGAVGAGRRLVELSREDGTCAGRFLFEGTELEAFQWQEGGPWAHRVSEAQHEKLRDLLATVPVVEAAALSR